jgi:hypothetical protein
MHVGINVHKEAISIAVGDSTGKAGERVHPAQQERLVSNSMKAMRVASEAES